MEQTHDAEHARSGPPSVLIVDDDRSTRSNFRQCLSASGYRVETVGDESQALQALGRGVFDVCLLDLVLGSTSGLKLLPRFREQAPWMRVIVITAHSSTDTTVEAIRGGARDFVVKPASPQRLRQLVGRHVDARRRSARMETLGRRLNGTDLGDSNCPAMQRVMETARQVAGTDAPVLICGESGTGKSLLAAAIHRWSDRADGEMVTVSCPALPTELVESELFGHVRGAFTGATHDSRGRVDQADGGTLFLDEIGDFPLALQPKLLRFVQDLEYERIGDPTTKRSNTRIIAATNTDLPAYVKEGRFREDLLYRLNVITLQLPALRERPQDIVDMAERLLAGFINKYRRPGRYFSEDARMALRAHPWPGNVRELRNVIERAAIICNDECVEPSHLALGIDTEISSDSPKAGDRISLQELERAHICAVLQQATSLQAAARVLQIDNSTLYRKRKAYGLD